MRTSARPEPIAPQSAPEVPSECLYVKRDEHAPNVPRGTIVTASDEVHRLTFAESRAMHARRYLVAVLETTGGERAAAARLAGIGRTTMQALIKRFGISIEFDPLARGRHGRRRSD
jgi:transcriptional regulator with GAF, ATPase, and Fis domain